jgi:hypothetical protein
MTGITKVEAILAKNRDMQTFLLREKGITADEKPELALFSLKFVEQFGTGSCAILHFDKRELAELWVLLREMLDGDFSLNDHFDKWMAETPERWGLRDMTAERWAAFVKQRAAEPQIVEAK